jgi:small-conductance mechanosensitive channel
MDNAGPNGALRLFGVALIGATPENGRKLLLTLGFILVVLLLGWTTRWIVAQTVGRLHSRKAAFWSAQIINILTAVFLLLGVLSIWFDDPKKLATAFGLVTAGLAFALQRVVTATAGYFIILRGKTFNVGDRIVMGGVRGDVVALSFMQTTILEMGQPPAVQDADPAMWVHGRQYTGRIVTITNAKIFDEPVYNFTREFPYLWEEMSVPVRYADDAGRAEAILMEAATKHTAKLGELGADDLAELQRRYFLADSDVRPKVYWRLTDNWVEMSVRFLAHAHGVRGLKDAMSREILRKFNEAGLSVASATSEIVGVPTLRIEQFGSRLSEARPSSPD